MLRSPKDCNNFMLHHESSERLSYRLLEDTDKEAWLAFYEDPDCLKFIQPDLTGNAAEKCDTWFKRVYFRYENNLGGMNALIEKNSNQLVGQCGLLIQIIDAVEELEIGYSILPNYRNQGFALEAARKCKEFAREHQLSNSLVSCIMDGNIFSEQVALKNGMHYEKTTFNNGYKINVFRIVVD